MQYMQYMNWRSRVTLTTSLIDDDSKLSNCFRINQLAGPNIIILKQRTETLAWNDSFFRFFWILKIDSFRY